MNRYIGMLVGFILSIFVSPTSFAFGTESGNGGDVCEMKINSIREDLQNWILAGNYETLNFPAAVTNNHYRQAMLSSLKAAKVNCVSSPVGIGETEKTCINSQDSNKNEMTCNISRFLSLSADNQYVLIHHEYAGLAGLEENSGEVSNYVLSSQITNYLTSQTGKRLGPKNAADGEPTISCHLSQFSSSGKSDCGDVDLTYAHSEQLGVGSCPDVAVDVLNGGSLWTVTAGLGSRTPSGQISMSESNASVEFEGNPPREFRFSVNLQRGQILSVQCTSKNWFNAIDKSH